MLVDKRKEGMARWNIFELRFWYEKEFLAMRDEIEAGYLLKIRMAVE